MSAIKDLGRLLYNSAQCGIITEPYSFDNMGGVVYDSQFLLISGAPMDSSQLMD